MEGGELTKLMEMSQTKGSRTQSMGVSPSPSSSFSPFLKSPGAGATGIPPVRLSTTSAIFIPLLTAMLAPPAPEAGSEAKNRAFQN